MAAGDASKKMKAVVLNRVGDKAAVTWSAAEVYLYLNEGFRALANILADAALYELTYVQSAELGDAQANYNLPADFLRVRTVKYKDDWAVQWPVRQLRSINAADPSLLLNPSETNPFYYLADGDLIFAVGSGGVTQGNGDTYELWYIKTPTAITDAVDPELGEEFYDIVEDFAVSRCQEQGLNFEEAAYQMAANLEKALLVNARVTSTVEAFDSVPKDPRLAELFQQGVA